MLIPRRHFFVFCSCPLAPRKSFDILALYKSDYYYYYYSFILKVDVHVKYYVLLRQQLYSLTTVKQSRVNEHKRPKKRNLRPQYWLQNIANNTQKIHNTTCIRNGKMSQWTPRAG